MARRTVADGTRVRTVNFLDPPLAGGRYQALVIAHLVDELTARPVEPRVRVETDLAGARLRSASHGVVGVAGVPDRFFPDLATLTYGFGLRASVPGYLPLRAEVALAPQPAFPQQFACADLGTVTLRRAPVTVTGTTVTLDPQNQTVPVPGASLTVTGIWRTVAQLTGPAAPALLLAVDHPIAAARPALSAVEVVVLAAVPGPPRALHAPAAPASTLIDVSRTSSLVPGSVVALDLGVPDVEEHVTVAQVLGPSDPESPGSLVLHHPLARRHRAGAAVQEVTVPPPGPPDALLTDAARPGDPVVFVSAVAAFGTQQTVRISGGGSASEYATVRRLQAVSGPDGGYRFPPLSRVAALTVAATSGPFTAGPVQFTPNYDAVHSRLDLTLA